MAKTRLGLVLLLTTCCGVLGGLGCSDDAAADDTGTDLVDAGGGADAAPDAVPPLKHESPAAKDDAYTATFGTTLTVAASEGVLVNDLKSGNVTVKVASPPANGTLVLAPDGGFVYDATSSDASSDSFTYLIEDERGRVSESATVSLSIRQPPRARADVYDVVVGTTLTATAKAPQCDAHEPNDTDGVLANDCAAAGANLSATLVSGPVNAETFTFNADGSFVYVPSQEFGIDTFTYRLSDGELSTTAKVTIDVRSCASTLENHGCEFLTGPGVWNCGSKNLTGANLAGCDLTNASFFNANLSGATFRKANLSGANFFDSTVTNATWSNTTCPTGVDSNANDGTCCGQFLLGQTPAGCGLP